ncbi:MAG: quinolinate synthase NadA [Candidatus Peregrinibacteria bacterium]|nr:quinolinate synthase NadA [Candidatus Peregrinibacteria bacterium]MDZ4245027.1 quinolinate synthase NadA [Candidatus Gracilibacteria bacterium]
MDQTTDLISEILSLKKQKNAVILAHNYQKKDIFAVADFIGDSLKLSQEAAKTDADIIVFCGVHFMAESAKILNPSKKVLLPAIDAGCAMSDMIDVEALKVRKKELLQKYPDLKVVCYVNTTAAVKAESDICCTSTNAVKVTESLDTDNILFVPDKNLAKYVAARLPEKNIIPWEGFCPIHHKITADYILKAKATHPNAAVIAHPECRPEVLKLADFVCSTGGMVKEAVTNSNFDEFIIITECGMTGRLMREAPGKKFFSVCNMCPDMKRTNLELIKDALINEQFEITVPEDIRLKALKTLERMLEVS